MTLSPSDRQEAGYTWLGRHPLIGFPVCLLMLPMYLLVAALDAFPSGYREWRSDLRELSLVRKRRPR